MSNNFVGGLYKVARTANTISAIGSGNPRRVARRATNVTVGKALARGGIWNKLWR